MYRGFNLELNENDLPFEVCLKSKSSKIPSLKSILLDPGEKSMTSQDNSSYEHCIEQMIQKASKEKFGSKQLLLEDFAKDTNSEDYFDVSKIQADWFPTDIDAHIFISHSRKDEKIAYKLACCLFVKFGLISFIDSLYWKYMEELLDLIYNLERPDKKNHKIDYKKRHEYTSHVYMMLAGALTRMINKTECMIFLKTHNSVPIKGESEKTCSPWIYHEIEIMNVIEKKIPNRIEEKPIIEQTKFGYDLDLNQLTNIDINTLKNWIKQNRKQPEDALDWLYKNVTQKQSPIKWLLD